MDSKFGGSWIGNLVSRQLETFLLARFLRNKKWLITLLRRPVARCFPNLFGEHRFNNNVALLAPRNLLGLSLSLSLRLSRPPCPWSSRPRRIDPALGIVSLFVRPRREILPGRTFRRLVTPLSSFLLFLFARPRAALVFYLARRDETLTTLEFPWNRPVRRSSTTTAIIRQVFSIELSIGISRERGRVRDLCIAFMSRIQWVREKKREIYIYIEREREKWRTNHEVSTLEEIINTHVTYLDEDISVNESMGFFVTQSSQTNQPSVQTHN